MIIYIVHCKISEKYYVGQTRRSLPVRWYMHVHEAANTKHKAHRSHFHAAIRKYGADAFESAVVIDRIVTQNQLNELETLWIWALKANDPAFGYNLGIGGEGVTLTSEVREKMRVAKLGKTWNVGRKRSSESRAKMSASHRGKTLSAETCKKLSKFRKSHPNCGQFKKGSIPSNKGKTASVELRQKLSLAHKRQTPWNKKKTSPLSSAPSKILAGSI